MSRDPVRGLAWLAWGFVAIIVAALLLEAVAALIEQVTK